jgi:hypothetical protein
VEPCSRQLADQQAQLPNMDGRTHGSSTASTASAETHVEAAPMERREKTHVALPHQVTHDRPIDSSSSTDRPNSSSTTRYHRSREGRMDQPMERSKGGHTTVSAMERSKGGHTTVSAMERSKVGHTTVSASAAYSANLKATTRFDRHDRPVKQSEILLALKSFFGELSAEVCCGDVEGHNGQSSCTFCKQRGFAQRKAGRSLQRITRCTAGEDNPVLAVVPEPTPEETPTSEYVVNPFRSEII